MGKRVILLLAVALAALVAAGASNAQRAVHLKGALPVDFSFQDPFLSGQCGFDVTVTFDYAADATLIYNDAGLVVREIDTVPTGGFTFSSAYGSLSGKPQNVIQSYPGGAALGSPANIMTTGMGFVVPGVLPANAGIEIIANAVVVGFTPEGIPLWDITSGTTFLDHGNLASLDEFVDAICTALGPTA